MLRVQGVLQELRIIRPLSCQVPLDQFHSGSALFVKKVSPKKIVRANALCVHPERVAAAERPGVTRSWSCTSGYRAVRERPVSNGDGRIAEPGCLHQHVHQRVHPQSTVDTSWFPRCIDCDLSDCLKCIKQRWQLFLLQSSPVTVITLPGPNFSLQAFLSIEVIKLYLQYQITPRKIFGFLRVI